MKRIDRSKLRYRRGVGVMLLNERNQVFVAKRSDFSGEAWQMPQGGIDAGEDPRQAALRELEEEIGTAEVEIIAETEGWLSYDLPEELMGERWGGGYRGQSLKWFLARFSGKDGDINLDTAQPEFSAWKWAALAELPDMVVPFKRRLYERIVTSFRHLAEPDEAR